MLSQRLFRREGRPAIALACALNYLPCSSATRQLRPLNLVVAVSDQPGADAAEAANPRPISGKVAA
jgi:hypothetical protein